jgi:hypothetical protein
MRSAVHEKKVGTETDEEDTAMNKKQAESLVAAHLLLEHSPVLRASLIMTDAPPALWPHALGKVSRYPSLEFLLLREFQLLV